MRRFGLIFLFLLGCAAQKVAVDVPPTAPVYYTRSNLRTLENDISSVNWQAAYLKMLPVNTQVQVSRFETYPPVRWNGPPSDPFKVTCFALRDVKSGATYTTTFDAVAANSEKLFSSEPVDLSKWEGEALEAIRKGVAVRGMSKEAVYVALGPPPVIMGANGGKVPAYTLPLGDIMKSAEWYYARKRGSEFLVRFEGEKVDRVE